VLLFIAGATVTEGIEPASFWATTVVEKVGIGLLAGVLVGAAGGEIIRRARRAGWSSAASEQFATAGIAVSLFIFTEEVGGSGFISAFVGGLFAGSRLGTDRRREFEFSDEAAAVLSAFVFFVLGLVAVELLDAITLQTCVYAVLALTFVRMTAVALALLGSGLRWPTVAFVGWFGPRGLASIVLALVALHEDGQLANIDVVVLATLVTVILSVVAHGLSAAPFSGRYARWAATLPSSAPEREAAAAFTQRSTPIDKRSA
jgi:sodium/hydrogen antiporter